MSTRTSFVGNAVLYPYRAHEFEQPIPHECNAFCRVPEGEHHYTEERHYEVLYTSTVEGLSLGDILIILRAMGMQIISTTPCREVPDCATFFTARGYPLPLATRGAMHGMAYPWLARFIVLPGAQVMTYHQHVRWLCDKLGMEVPANVS